MMKKLTVKQKHRYTKQSLILYSGKTDYQLSEKGARISYIEDGSACKVTLLAGEKMMVLERIGLDLQTKLSFINGEYTQGIITSEYGSIDVQIYTHKYIIKDYAIAIEYDIIVNDEVSDGYRIIWSLSEVSNESN